MNDLPEDGEKRTLFEEGLPLLCSVGRRVLSQSRVNPLDLVTAGAISLWRLALQYSEESGIPFQDWAELALLVELSAFVQMPASSSLPEVLAPFAPRLIEIARELSEAAPEVRLVPYRSGPLVENPEFSVQAWSKSESPGEFLAPFLRSLRRYWIMVLALVILAESGVLFFSLREKKVYQATATLNTGIGGGNNLSGQATDWFRAGTVMANLTELMKSRTVLKATVTSLHLPSDDESLERLAKKIQIDRISNTDLLRISATGNSPEEAALLANTQVNEFARYYASMQSQDARSADSFIKRQVGEAETKLRGAEERLKRFKSATVPESESKIAGRLADLDVEREEIYKGIAAAKAGLAAVQRELSSLKVDPTLVRQVSQSNEVLSAGERLRVLQQNLDDARSSGVSDPSLLANLKSQIRQAKGRIRETAASTTQVNPAIADAVARRIAFKVELAQGNAKLAALEDSIRRLRPLAQAASQNEISLKQLQREVALAEGEYQRLTEKSGQTNLALHGSLNLSLTVVDPAFPPKKPVSRKIPLKLAIGFILSLLLGCTLAYGLSRFVDRRFRPVEST
ncbi:MAG TPA: hypothetical protein DD435_01490 [Cyanobacteria bacterium UBA8530]|nr:hypothetical protein [Cyanobacteria bacterium UBA8530]